MTPTLLLADDSVTIQRVIELTFADEDVNVVAVSDGEEAIALLERTPPDIVLADVGMPGRSGYEVAQHIRDTPRLAHIPVLLLTGAFEPLDQAKAAAAGCDGVLAKPFEPQMVIGRVKELLSKARTRHPLDAPLAAPSAPAQWRGPIPEAGAVEPPDGDNADYFDRLDQAFANLSAIREPNKPAEASPAATALDWFASQQAPTEPSPQAASFDARPRSAPPVRPFDGQFRHFDGLPNQPFTAHGDAFEPPGSYDANAVTPVAPIQDRWETPQIPLSYASPPPSSAADYGQNRAVPLPPTLPPLADAFAALLAAEQASPSRGGAPLWPTLPAATVVDLSDETIEKIVQRVVERLSDRVVRDTVGERVSSVAERLVREEIERIKASIK